MSDNTAIEHAAATWLARRDGDGWNPADAAALASWLEDSLAHRVAFLRLEDAWHQASRLRMLVNDLAPEAPVTAATPAACSSSKQRDWVAASPWRHAFTAALVAAVGISAYLGWQATGRHHSSHSSGIGQIQALALADGSEATLGSDSRIEVDISRGRRDVYLLHGEAIFEVSHDPARRFVVHVEGRRVTAIGTRFSVRNDPGSLRVVVTEGTVRLDAEATPDGVEAPVSLLPAGSIARVDADEVRLESIPPEEANRLLDWRSGFLDFDATPLADAIAEFNRYHVRKLELADADLAGLAIGGSFRWSNLDGFVRLLEQGFPLRAERLPDRVVLHRL